MKMYIYCLIDPRTKMVFYVGQTKDTHTRLIRHLQESLRGKYPKDSRITELVRLGMIPEIKVVEEIDVEISRKKFETKTSEREKYWTDFYSKDNQLDNMQNNKNGIPEKNNKICLYCGKDYYAFSSKSKYCSTVCRVYWNRELKAVKLLGKVFEQERVEINKVVTDIMEGNIAITHSDTEGNVRRVDPLSEEGQNVQNKTTRQPFMTDAIKKKLGIK